MLLTSSVEIGQGTQTSLAQIVAEELGISAERVSVTFPDTDVTPFDQSTSSSRTIFTMGSAARQAAQQIRAAAFGDRQPGCLRPMSRILELVDGFLAGQGSAGEETKHFAIISGALRSGGGEHGRELRQADAGGLDPKTGKGKGSAFFFLSACAAEVEVDTETGKVTVSR